MFGLLQICVHIKFTASLSMERFFIVIFRLDRNYIMIVVVFSFHHIFFKVLFDHLEGLVSPSQMNSTDVILLPELTYVKV